MIKDINRYYKKEESLNNFQKAIYMNNYYRDNCVLPELKEEFKDAVVHFVETMEANYDKEDLQNLYRNVESLKIIYFNIFNRIYTQELFSAGTYDYKNIIHIDRNYLKLSINHELLHMASTKRKEDGTMCIGFRMYDKKNRLSTALNEGYTSLLAERLFGEEVFYSYEYLIAVALEEILGKKAMGKYYLNGDLDGLIDELSKYSSKQDVYDFLNCIKYAAYNYVSDDSTLIKDIIISFMLKVFVNKNKDKETFLYDYKNYITFLNCLVLKYEDYKEDDIPFRLTDTMIDEDFVDLSECGIKKGLKKVS